MIFMNFSFLLTARCVDEDGVDLHIAEMLYSPRHRLRPLAEWRALIQPLGTQPDTARG